MGDCQTESYANSGLTGKKIEGAKERYLDLWAEDCSWTDPVDGKTPVWRGKEGIWQQRSDMPWMVKGEVQSTERAKIKNSLFTNHLLDPEKLSACRV